MAFQRCYSCMRELVTPAAECPFCGYDNANGPRTQPPQALRCGAKLHGKYVVGRVLQTSRFSISYIAWDEVMDTAVCIKEYFPTGAGTRDSSGNGAVIWNGGSDRETLLQGRERFLKEARKAAKLRDLKNVVNVWDVFSENETAYIIMDYIEGTTLMNHLLKTRRPLTEAQCVEMFGPVMADLEQFHRREIVHRDICPEKLMLQPDGTVVLLDLGTAKDLSFGSENSTYIARKGFSPMEQQVRSGEIGPWSDVYSMCATIVFCVTGRRLPEPIDRAQGKPLDLSAFTPAFAAVLERGLRVEPRDRIQTVGELRRELQKALDPTAPIDTDNGKDGGDTLKLGGDRPSPHRTLPLILGGAAALAVIVAGIGFALGWWGGGDKTESAETAAAVETSTTTEAAGPTETPEPAEVLPPETAEVRYNDAEALLADGDEAYAAMTFYSLGSYRDARERSFALWDQIAQRTTSIAAFHHFAYLRTNGTPAVTEETHDVSGWTDLVSVAAGFNHTVGLKKDGTVVAAGDNGSGQCEVSGWRDIVAVAAGNSHTVGLRKDGTVVAVGDNRSKQCRVSDWRDIVAVAAGYDGTLGLRADGSVVATGLNGSGQCEVSDWRDIVAVAVGADHNVGLRADGSVVTAGSSKFGQCEVSDWTDIVAVAAGYDHTVGLKKDGSVVAAGQNDNGQCDVSAWKEIVAVAAGYRCSLALQADDRVLAVGLDAGALREDASLRYLETPVLHLAESMRDGIQVIWGPVAGAEQYRVYRRSGDGNWAALVNTGDTVYIDRDVRAGTSYTYTVRCLDAEANTTVSGYDRAGVTATHAETQQLAVPVLTAAARAQDGVRVTWAAVEGANRYRLYRRSGDENWTVLLETADTSAVDTNVRAGTVYTYTVRCLDAESNTTVSDFDKVGISFRCTESSPVRLVGSWGEKEAIHSTSTAPFFLEEEQRDCRKLTMKFEITRYTGDPFGVWCLYAKDLDDNWTQLGEFEIEQSQADGGVRSYDFRFDEPQSFRALAICKRDSGSEYSLWRNITFFTGD